MRARKPLEITDGKEPASRTGKVVKTLRRERKERVKEALKVVVKVKIRTGNHLVYAGTTRETVGVPDLTAHSRTKRRK